MLFKPYRVYCIAMNELSLKSLVCLLGCLIALWPGAWVVGRIVKPFSDSTLPAGFKGGGKLIGYFERFLIFVGLLLNSYALVGIVLTLKVAYRFNDISGDTETKMKISEYFIIGTFASISWVLVVFELCRMALKLGG